MKPPIEYRRPRQHALGIVVTREEVDAKLAEQTGSNAKFDRKAYQREYMRRYRAKGKK